MQSTEKSLRSLPPTGSTRQLLAQVAAPPETPTELPCSKDTLIALLAVIEGLLANTHSEDVLYLALSSAYHRAERNGVPAAEIEHVQEHVVKLWATRHARDPMSELFT